MDVVKLAPRVRPASCFVDIIAVKVMKARISVGLESALEGLQMLAGMLALAVFRVCEPNCRRGLVASRPVISHVGPETASPGLPTAGREHGYGRIVGVQLAAGEDMLLNRVHQGAQ